MHSPSAQSLHLLSAFQAALIQSPPARNRENVQYRPFPSLGKTYLNVGNPMERRYL